jgi:hypothetical protein
MALLGSLAVLPFKGVKMDKVKNIYQRISAVMADTELLLKEDKKVNNQYTFISHDAVTENLQPLLIKHGIVWIPDVVSHLQDGNRTEVLILNTFINIDNPEDRITFKSFGYGIDAQDKGPGKAVSYAVKYAALKLFVWPTGDDNEKDNADHKPGKTQQKVSPKVQEDLDDLGNKVGPQTTKPQSNKFTISEKQLSRLYAIAHQCKADPGMIKNYLIDKFRLESSKDLDKYEYDTLINEIQAGKLTPVKEDDKIPFA